MYVLQVLNSANEWELIAHKFDSEQAAIVFFHNELNMFDDYTVTKLD